MVATWRRSQVPHPNEILDHWLEKCLAHSELVRQLGHGKRAIAFRYEPQ